MLTKYQPINYLEKKLKYAPIFEYKPIQLNPAKGISYKENANSSKEYNQNSTSLTYSFQIR